MNSLPKIYLALYILLIATKENDESSMDELTVAMECDNDNSLRSTVEGFYSCYLLLVSYLHKNIAGKIFLVFDGQSTRLSEDRHHAVEASGYGYGSPHVPVSSAHSAVW